MGFYRNTRRIKRTPEEAAELKAANASAKALRERNAMTCQCCGRKFLANMGSIAHHGYERPGDGYQTASCIGAKFAPFEVSRDRLKLHIDGQRERLVQEVLARKQMAAEKFPVSLTTLKRQRDAWARKEYVRIEVTRETFEGQRDELRKVFAFYGTFDDLKASDLGKRDAQIRGTRDYIKMQQGRYDGWAGVTHHWDDAAGTWMKN